MELENENLDAVKNAFFRMPTSDQGDRRSHTQQVVKLKTRKDMLCSTWPAMLGVYVFNDSSNVDS
jgi:hypothetical protein